MPGPTHSTPAHPADDALPCAVMSRPDDIPRRADYGSGIYRRRISLFTGTRSAFGELEDDFHHFRASLRHDGEHVVEMQGEGVRIPWTTCGGSVEPLAALEGKPLSARLHEVMRYVDPRQQCTHLHDAAMLALTNVTRFLERFRAQGGEDHETHRYDVAIPDRVGGATTATLDRDGERLLTWELDGDVVASPGPFEGVSLMGAAFNLKIERSLDPEAGEAALVLRRACFISMGRRWDFERIERATTFGKVVGAACHTFHASRVGDATHVPGTVRDFTDDETAGGR